MNSTQQIEKTITRRSKLLVSVCGDRCCDPCRSLTTHSSCFSSLRFSVFVSSLPPKTVGFDRFGVESSRRGQGGRFVASPEVTVEVPRAETLGQEFEGTKR